MSFPGYRVASRGPLPHIVLSGCGEDVRRCTSCWGCEAFTAPDMDLSISELMRGAARNDERVLCCASLWACEPLVGRVICQQGINVPLVLEVLRKEARRRGYVPPSSVERSTT
jgi:heterodisulfide reductase subunit C